MAPKSLDHFKRGYQERADQREREYYGSRANGRRGRAGGVWRGNPSDRSPVFEGFHVYNYLDMLRGKNRQQVYDELDKARTQYAEVMEGGKALTALISGAARRQQPEVARWVWEWMDIKGIKKNTYVGCHSSV